MNHTDHVRMIAAGVPSTGGIWADLGCGSGAFTLALRDVAGPDVRIIAFDTDRHSLDVLARRMAQEFPGTVLQTAVADIRDLTDVGKYDGIIAANSLHYIPTATQPKILQRIRRALSSEGRLIVVEYDTDRGNQWVPYPFSLRSLHELAASAGFEPPRSIGAHPSRFLGSIYAALLVPESTLETES